MTSDSPNGTLIVIHAHAMTITLPAEQDSILARLVALGKFASPQEVVSEALRRLDAEEGMNWLRPEPLTANEAAQIYAPDTEWERVERALAGRVKPEV